MTMQKIKTAARRVAPYATGLAVTGMLAVSRLAQAAADPDITDALAPVATAVKENVFAVVSDNLPTLGIIFVLFLGITVIFKLSRRVAK